MKTTKLKKHSVKQINKNLEEIKQLVEQWSGFKLQPDEETKTGYNKAIEHIQYQLECEISDKGRSFCDMINKLDIEEGG